MRRCMWGVEVIEIDGEEHLEIAVEKIDPRMLARARREIAARFTNAFEDHRFLNELRVHRVARTRTDEA